MTIRNMANMNTLFKKGYLFAVVIMAANMFVVNEMKAMNDNRREPEKDMKEGNDESTFLKFLDMTSGFVLKWENLINFIGGAVFSGANNYFKWWDYKPGTYWKLAWFGWRSKRFLKDILQFEINLNAVRGAFWLLPGTYNFIKGFPNNKGQYFEPLHVSFLLACCVDKFLGKENNFVTIIEFIVFFLLQGFVSMPLTLHIPKINLSISISLDSILWGVAGMILDEKEVPNEENPNEKNENELKNY